MNEFFRRFAHKCSAAFGSSWAFIFALMIVIIWAATGPIFHFSDTWQLVINTSTTIVTFLMVFLIQNMQNRDAKAIHLKLDELIRSVKDARTGLVDLENLSDEELSQLQKEFEALSKRHSNRIHNIVEAVEGKNRNIKKEERLDQGAGTRQMLKTTWIYFERLLWKITHPCSVLVHKKRDSHPH